MNIDDPFHDVSPCRKYTYAKFKKQAIKTNYQENKQKDEGSTLHFPFNKALRRQYKFPRSLMTCPINRQVKAMPVRSSNGFE
jgi:hypothetical protein